MNYGEFERLYCDEPLVFHMAMEIFMDSGRDLIESMSDQELNAEAVRHASEFFSKGKIDETVKAVRDFAGMNTMELFSYAARCGVRLEDEPIDKPGVCPLCGGKLDYGGDASADRFHAVGWTCESCGATGKEAYREVFDCHYDVRDSGGKPVVWRNEYQ